MREIRIEQTYTKRDEDSLNRYLNDLSRIQLITAKEEVQLAQMIRKGDSLARHKLVKANLRFVVSVAKKYQGHGLPLNDLVNEGNIGLIKAAERFDETKGFKFISYAVWWIRQAMLMAVSENTRTVRVPMNQVLSIQKINAQQAILEQQLEREPTLAELADAVHMEESMVIHHLSRNRTTKSLDEKIVGETELDFGGCIADPNMVPADEQVNYESMREDVRQLLNVLHKREQKIIMELFGLCGMEAMSMEDVALRNDLSKERVRQLKYSGMEKLKHHATRRFAEHLQN